MRRVEAGVEPGALIKRVCVEFGVGPGDLQKRRSLADARLTAAALLKELTGLTQRDIGREVGLRDGSGLGRLLKLAGQKLSESWRLRRRYARIRKALQA